MNRLGYKLELNTARVLLDKANDIIRTLSNEIDDPDNMDVFLAMLIYRYLECVRVAESEDDPGALMNLEQAKKVLARIDDIALKAYNHLALGGKA